MLYWTASNDLEHYFSSIAWGRDCRYTIQIITNDLILNIEKINQISPFSVQANVSSIHDVSYDRLCKISFEYQIRLQNVIWQKE